MNRAIFCAAALILALSQSLHAESNWPRWRGPLQDGHSTETDLPLEWSDDSVVWRAPLKGLGQSSPIIWGERIFLTTALDEGKQRVVMCLNRNDGKVEWEQVAWSGSSVEPLHKMNTHASSTCVTDGERVYAFFGRGGGLFCYTVEGEKVWSKELGYFEGPWGTAACPVLVGDLVIQNCDADKDAYIIGLNKYTGEEVWRTPRDNHRGWSTPVLIEAAGRQELVVNGHSGPKGYDPKTGRELWYCKSFNGRGEPTATPYNGLLHFVNGLSGDTYAVKPGGNGTVTSSHMVWHTPRKGGRDLPSPIVVDGTVMVMSMGGILTGYEASSGRQLWVERVGGNYSASPIAYRGKAVFIDESGEGIVVDPRSEEHIVARNRLTPVDDEIFRASITPSEGQLFIRTTAGLYCVGERRNAE